MKRIIYIICFINFVNSLFAQDEIYNNGSVLHVNNGATILVNGSLTFAAGSDLTNNGTISITENLINHQTMLLFNTGTFKFVGSSSQLFSGTLPFLTKHLVINNAAGVTLNNTFKVDGDADFTNGIVGASNNSFPLWFTENGTHSNTSNISHVNGYVVKEGLGNFVYPVGNGIRYQQTDINLSTNASGMQVKYNPLNAGGGNGFTNAGTESTPLVSYNKLEYWEIAPLSTATGSVTIYWDDYLNESISNISDLKVAHRIGLDWVNEGTSGTGTILSGSVTSNSLSSWSPFTLGSTAVILPIKLLQFNAFVNGNDAVLNWKIAQAENGVKYELLRSTDSRNFNLVNLQNGNNIVKDFNFIDASLISGTYYYKLKVTDKQGTITYSNIAIVRIGKGSDKLFIYPNPVLKEVTKNVQISISNNTIKSYIITDGLGKIILQNINVNVNGSITVALPSSISAGLYYIQLKTTNGIITEKILVQ